MNEILNVSIHGIRTLILMIIILGIYAWAWSSKREVAFKEAANLALGNRNNNPEKVAS